MSNFGSVHVTKKNTKGSKLGTAIVVLLVLGLGGGGYYFYSNQVELVRHVDQQDDFALAAAYVLWFKGVPPEAVSGLRKGLESGKPGLKKACARALGSMKNNENTAFLADAATNDPDPEVRAAAVTALGENGDPNVSLYMDKILDDDSVPVLEAGCITVGKLGLMRYVPRLIGYLNHPNGDVDRAALKGLEEFTEEGQSFGFDPLEWNKWYEGQYE